MRNLFPFLFFFSFFVQLGFAQDNIIYRDRLTKLLQERKDTFEIYFESIEARSGIFGNQTKNDLKKVNEILTDIVKTDNVIYKELYRMLDYKNFENNNIGDDVNKFEGKVNILETANDTLSKQVLLLRNENVALLHEKKISNFWRNLSLFISAFLLIYILIKKIRR